jgi:hypothetical protein
VFLPRGVRCSATGHRSGAPLFKMFLSAQNQPKLLKKGYYVRQKSNLKKKEQLNKNINLHSLLKYGPWGREGRGFYLVLAPSLQHLTWYRT